MSENVLDEFAKKFTEIVEKCTDYIIVSGFVAISSGRARATEDIDMIIKPMSVDKFRELHFDLIENGYYCLQSDDADTLFEYLTNFDSVRYCEQEKLIPQMEIKFAKDELDMYQFKTKTKLELTGLDIWFSNINVNIAFKEYYLKSKKDLDDAKHLRIVYSHLISDDEINFVEELIKKCRMK